MPTGKLKLEKSHMCARFVSYWESATLVTLEPAYAPAGAVFLRSRILLLAPVFLFCFVFGPQKGACLGRVSVWGTVRGGGRDREAVWLVELVLNIILYIIRSSGNVMYL